MIENRTILHEITESLINLLQQFLLYFNLDNLRWRKIKEVLDLSFYQGEVEVRSLQNVLNRKQDKLQLSSFLQSDLVLVMDKQVLVHRTWKVISKHTGINGNVLSFCKEGI